MSFNFQPTLKSELLHIRALQAGDFDALFAVVSDPLLWEQHPQKDRYHMEVYQQWFEAAIQAKSLIVLDRDTNLVMGSSRYYEVDEAKKELAIGYTFLAREYWGGKINKELKRLMLEHAFQSFELVWFHIAEENLRSRKAAEKIDAKLSHIGEKQGVPYCWYCLTR